MKTQFLISLISTTTTVNEIVERLQIQILSSGLLEDFDSLKNQMRATPVLAVEEIITRVLKRRRRYTRDIDQGDCWSEKSASKQQICKNYGFSHDKDTYLKNDSSFQN